MRKGLALMLCVVFTIVAVTGLCWAQKNWKSEGKVGLVGGVFIGEGYPFLLETDKGVFVLGGADLHSGADPSRWVGKKVKVSGELLSYPGARIKHIKVDKFEAAE